jgi:predicted RNA binding protein YcfA (HicA-like mRNA interferase family)
MVRRLYNWTYRDVTDFLRKNGFSFFKGLKGSHQAWIKRGKDGEPDRIVEVNIPRNSYPPKTLKKMILKSGISHDKWMEWGSS